MSPPPFTLHLVRTADVPKYPALDAIDGQLLQQWFSQATNRELDLRIQFHSPLNITGAVDGGILHQVLRATLPMPTQRPVNDIAVLFCRRWIQNVGLQGLMFDYDGMSQFGLLTSGDGVPREGCAVFTDEFESSDDYEQIFTAIHELGHVFNLVHDPSGQSFMTAQGGVPGFSLPDSSRLMAAARRIWEYVPGGMNFTGQESPARWKQGKPRLSRSISLALKAGVGKAHYLLGESIVLDLELRSLAGKASVFPVLDPGYPDLRIWIENGLGERYVHRPNLSYCRSHLRKVVITPQRPLRHNPRISFGRMGLNFDQAGIYRIWAEMRIFESGRPQVIRSCDIELEIVTPIGKTHQDME